MHNKEKTNKYADHIPIHCMDHIVKGDNMLQALLLTGGTVQTKKSTEEII